MTFQLRSDEVMEALLASEHPQASVFIAKVEAAVNEAAEALAEHLGIKAGVGDFEGIGFAGLCVPFGPSFEGQELPDVIERFDNEEQWSPL